MNRQAGRTRKGRGNDSRTSGRSLWTGPRAAGVLLVNVVIFAAYMVLASAPAQGTPSGGSGGAFADQTFQGFTASNGLSSQYHLYAAGLSRTSALCAVFQFHGDGAYEFKNPTSSYSLGGAAGIVAVSRARGCITVPVLTPDKVGSVTWWESGAANAVFARDLMKKIKSDYNIDSKRIWLVGYSGGAQFITQFLLPQYSSVIDGGGAVVFGGGGVPYSVPELPYAPGLVKGFHMHWYTGADDDGSTTGYNALRDAKAGEARYAARGFATSHLFPANTAHALNGRFGGVLDQQLKMFDNALPVVTTSATAVPTTSSSSARPTTTPAGWNHRVTPSKTGATLTVDVPTATVRTTFRVSASPFGTQTGFYLYTGRTGPGISLRLSSVLSPGRLYYYQVENGRGRSVVAVGTFRTLT